MGKSPLGRHLEETLVPNLCADDPSVAEVRTLAMTVTCT